MKKALTVTNLAGEFLGFIERAGGGLYRASIFLGVSTGPFFSAAAARQYIWRAYSNAER
jgi:hypothetical protein